MAAFNEALNRSNGLQVSFDRLPVGHWRSHVPLRFGSVLARVYSSQRTRDHSSQGRENPRQICGLVRPQDSVCVWIRLSGYRAQQAIPTAEAIASRDLSAYAIL